MAISKNNREIIQGLTILWAVFSTFFAFYDGNQTKKIESVDASITLLDSKISRYLEKTHANDIRLARLEEWRYEQNAKGSGSATN